MVLVRAYQNNSKAMHVAALVLMVMVGVIGLVANVGCDTYGGMGMPYYATGLYDPTADIQSVIGYRQSVMDYSADAWDAYIRE